MTTAILDHRGIVIPPTRRKPHPHARTIHARYDAAATNNDNRRHWANADDLSAAAANSTAVRQTIAKRVRYEVANNGYGKGAVLTLANDTIGTGPRLQMRLPFEGSRGGAEDPNTFIETEFANWAKATHVARKLRCAKMAKTVDGEAFLWLRTNSKLWTPVKLDLRNIECEQIATPGLTQFSRAGDQQIDGIEYDADGNPTFYHLLTQHPGDAGSFGMFPNEYERIPASLMIHLQRHDRPGQVRAVSEMTSCAGDFAETRRFMLATIRAAETAADHAGLLESHLPPGDDDDEPEPMDTLEVERGMLTVTPKGWRLGQLKAEHPSTTYADFEKSRIKQMARPLLMPLIVAGGDASGYNYSSGRLDNQTYDRSIEIEKSDIEVEVLDEILGHWLAEASLLPDYLPMPVIAAIDETIEFLRQFNPLLDGTAIRRAACLCLSHEWFWDGREHVDPSKESNADDVDLKNGTKTLARIKGKAGIDWQSDLEQLAKEVKAYEAMGLVHPYAMAAKTLEQKAAQQPQTEPRDEAMTDTELEDEEALADA